jgi:hypothetical protein
MQCVVSDINISITHEQMLDIQAKYNMASPGEVYADEHYVGGLYPNEDGAFMIRTKASVIDKFPPGLSSVGLVTSPAPGVVTINLQ